MTIDHKQTSSLPQAREKFSDRKVSKRSDRMLRIVSVQIHQALSDTGVLKRIHLEDMGSPAAYMKQAETYGMSLVSFEDRFV